MNLLWRRPYLLFVIGAPWGWACVDRVQKELGCCRYTLGKISGDVDLLRAVRHHQPKWMFFLNWSRRVPDDVLAEATCINFHCTDLANSYGRGGGPVENLILRGHSETVITAHQMVREMDAGPVYAQSEPISLAGAKEDILQRFVEPTAELIEDIIRGNVEPKPQQGEPTYFKRLKPAEYEAFWVARGGRV